MYENCVLQRNGFSRTVLWSQAKQQVHGFIRWRLRCCCQFITKLMVTLMTATNDTNRPVLIQTHPRKSPTQGALPSNHLHLLQILRFLQTSQPVFLAPKLPVVCARDNYSTSCRPFYASSASSSLDWASSALTQGFILFHTNASRVLATSQSFVLYFLNCTFVSKSILIVNEL